MAEVYSGVLYLKTEISYVICLEKGRWIVCFRFFLSKVLSLILIGDASCYANDGGYDECVGGPMISPRILRASDQLFVIPCLATNSKVKPYINKII